MKEPHFQLSHYPNIIPPHSLLPTFFTMVRPIPIQPPTVNDMYDRIGYILRVQMRNPFHFNSQHIRQLYAQYTGGNRSAEVVSWINYYYNIAVNLERSAPPRYPTYSQPRAPSNPPTYQQPLSVPPINVALPNATSPSNTLRVSPITADSRTICHSPIPPSAQGSTKDVDCDNRPDNFCLWWGNDESDSDDEESVSRDGDEDTAAETNADDENNDNLPELIEYNLDTDEIHDLPPVLLDKYGYGMAASPKKRYGNKARKKHGRRNIIGRKLKRRRPKVNSQHRQNESTDLPAPNQDVDSEEKDDGDDDEDGDDVAAKPSTWKTDAEKERLQIALMYSRTLNSPPPEEWAGKDGTVRQIMVKLELGESKRFTVKRVIKQTYEMQEEGLDYDGKVREGRGRESIIAVGSKWEKMIADHKESGLSFEETTQAVNDVRHKENSPLFRVGAIKGVIARLPKRIVNLTRKAQGSYDESSDWAKARLGFSLQVLVRARKITPQQVKDILGLEESDPLPDKFNINKLTKIHPEAIGWFDEVHRNCFVGDLV